MTGPRTTAAIPVMSWAAVTTARLGASVTTKVPTAVSAAAPINRPRLGVVRSISAPAGAFNSRPTAPPRVRTSPMLADSSLPC